MALSFILQQVINLEFFAILSLLLLRQQNTATSAQQRIGLAGSALPVGVISASLQASSGSTRV
jgi:hypothetical protein